MQFERADMIPTAIVLGLIGGLIPRYRWWSIPVIGVTWSIMLSIGGDPSMSLGHIWTAGFAFGAGNGAVGVPLRRTVEGHLRRISMESRPNGGAVTPAHRRRHCI